MCQQFFLQLNRVPVGFPAPFFIIYRGILCRFSRLLFHEYFTDFIDWWRLSLFAVFRKRRRDRAPAIHVLPDVLRVRQPGVRPPDSAQDAQLEAALQVLPLVSVRRQMYRAYCLQLYSHTVIVTRLQWHTTRQQTKLYNGETSSTGCMDWCCQSAHFALSCSKLILSSKLSYTYSDSFPCHC